MLRPSGRPRLLWQSRGFQLSRYRQEADGAWNCHSNYFGTFADAASGAPISEWDNPFTGRRDVLPPTVYGPMDYVLTASRTLVKPTAAERAAALAERRVRRWSRTGALVSILDELGPPGDAGKPPDLDLVTLSARVADLADPALASVPSQTAFGAVEPWREDGEEDEEADDHQAHQCGRVADDGKEAAVDAAEHGLAARARRIVHQPVGEGGAHAPRSLGSKTR